MRPWFTKLRVEFWRGIQLDYSRSFWKSFWNSSSKVCFWLLQFYWHFENLFQNLFEKDLPLIQWGKLALVLSAISISIRFSNRFSIIQLNCTRSNMILRIILKMILKLNNSIEFLSRPNGRRDVVVAGGSFKSNFGASPNVDIYSVDDDTWSEGGCQLFKLLMSWLETDKSGYERDISRFTLRLMKIPKLVQL